MAKFDYNAIDRDGQRVTGRMEALDVGDAVTKLLERGVIARVEDLVVAEDSAGGELAEVVLVDEGAVGEPDRQEDREGAAKEGGAPRLSGKDTAELVQTVVDLTSSDLPLSAGLRAAAEEMPRRRLARAMVRLAAELDRGVSLDQALGTATRNVPDHLRGLILAGLRTGQVAHVLEELIVMDRDRVDLRRRVFAALAYPTILLALLLCGFVFANVYIIKPFQRIFDEFGVDLPDITLMLITMSYWFDRSGTVSVMIALGIVLPAFVVLIVMPKPADLQRACYRFPVIGPLWRWQSLVDFSRLMHLFLARHVPLADALRFTAEGLRWSDLAAVSRACAIDVEKGMALTESMAKHREFPASMHPVIESGFRSQDPSQAFAAAADMYRRRAGVDATLWEAILPPLILVIVAVGLGFLILGMFLPLIKLISSLS